jgi:hypothetical protein
MTTPRAPIYAPSITIEAGGRLLDLMQAVVALAAILVVSSARTAQPVWIAVGIAIPVFRLVSSQRFRQRALAWLETHWRSFDDVRPGRSLPWKATFVCVVTPTVLVAGLGPYDVNGGDSQPVVCSAVSVLRHGSLELSDFGRRYDGSVWSRDGRTPYFFTATAAGLYSSYPSGMVVFAVPTTTLAWSLGADLFSREVASRIERWTACWVEGLCIGLFFLIALHLVRPGPAWVTAALLATGSALYSTVGMALWQHGGVVFWSLVLLLVELRRPTRPLSGAMFLQGLAIAMLAATRLSSGLIVGPFLVWVLVRAPLRAIAIGVTAGFCWIPWALVYSNAYGTPLGPSTGQLHAANWMSDLGPSLAAVLISPSHGLFIYQPWLLLAALLIVPAVRRTAQPLATEPAGWKAFCTTAVVLHVLLISAWGCWWGGACWGSRLLTDVLPLASFFCLRPVAWLLASPFGRASLLGLGLIGLALHPIPIQGRFPAPDYANRPLELILWSWSDAPFLPRGLR